MTDWIDQAARGILSRYDQWEAEAGQLAQSQQDADAGECHMHQCLVNYLRWMQANHSRTTCRRCSECPGMSHHWIPDPIPEDADDDEFLPGDYACKHCDQRGDGCEECCGDGYLDGDETKPCTNCDQEGVVPIPTEQATREE